MKVKKLREIFQEEVEGKIVLPNFQREFVWEAKQQKELIQQAQNEATQAAMQKLIQSVKEK